jgi:hypothetical protein
MTIKDCNKCSLNPLESKLSHKPQRLFQLTDDAWWCQYHALQHLDMLESKLIYSPNRSTSITEQLLLDEIRVLKVKLK